MKERILIVDDIGKNIQVLGSILSKDAFAISYATDGAQALDMIESRAYDLILLDIMMPGMDGFEVCRRIKQMPDKEDIPVIFLTARTQKHDIVQGLETGAVDYITKPFNATELKARVQTHLQLKLARDRLREQNERLEQLNTELNQAMEKIKILEGVLPICSVCKKIRDDEGDWQILESYVEKHSEVSFTHSLCAKCSDDLYGGEDWYVKMKKDQ